MKHPLYTNVKWEARIVTAVDRIWGVMYPHTQALPTKSLAMRLEVMLFTTSKCCRTTLAWENPVLQFV